MIPRLPHEKAAEAVTPAAKGTPARATTTISVRTEG